MLFAARLWGCEFYGVYSTLGGPSNGQTRAITDVPLTFLHSPGPVGMVSDHRGLGRSWAPLLYKPGVVRDLVPCAVWAEGSAPVAR